MRDYSYIKDEKGNVQGMWLENTSDASDTYMVEAILTGDFLDEDNLDEDIPFNIPHGEYRIVDNNYDDKGGCFVMFGSAIAPGEKKKPWWKFW